MVEDEFHTTTAGITVEVRAHYIEHESQPENARFVWAYHIKITNATPVTVKLLSRTWRITDAHGHVLVVEGVGVIGKQPVLAPGASFEYSSGTPLHTASGFMSGSYHMVNPETGEEFDVAIPVFSLDSPYQSHQVH